MSSVALEDFLGKRKDKKLCHKAVEVENPGKQTTGGPSQWGKEKEKKTEPRCFMEKTFVPHQGLSSGDATQSSPPHLIKKKKEYIHLAAESRQRPSNAAGWESQVQVPSPGVPNEIWLLFFPPRSWLMSP